MNIAVVFAGGVGSRARSNGSSMPKQFLVFHGKPILIHTLEHFERHPDIDAISLAMVGEWLDYTKELIEQYNLTKVKWLVEGGNTGQDSIHNALSAIEGKIDGSDIVLIHDGVRPLITGDLITRNIEQARETGAAITAYPTTETSVVSRNGVHVDEVLDRSVTYIAQAPQTFRLETFQEAHRKAIKDGKHDFIDSCSLFRAYNKEPVSMVMGSRSNLKITTPHDFYIFEALYNVEEQTDIQRL